ncbi:MAG: 30S ribosomal protein S9 [Anaerohalosphaeraceae bacterium]
MAENETYLIDPKILEKSASALTSTAPAAAAKRDAAGFVWGTGRRKTSVARVRLKPGTGKIEVNGRPFEEYFLLEKDRESVRSPLAAVNGLQSFDVIVNVKGGGTTGQADAVKLGIARALKDYDPSLLKVLRDGDFLTRDSRMVERKKAGKPGARRSFQFSKR